LFADFIGQQITNGLVGSRLFVVIGACVFVHTVKTTMKICKNGQSVKIRILTQQHTENGFDVATKQSLG